MNTAKTYKTLTKAISKQILPTLNTLIEKTNAYVLITVYKFRPDNNNSKTHKPFLRNVHNLTAVRDMVVDSLNSFVQFNMPVEKLIIKYQEFNPKVAIPYEITTISSKCKFVIQFTYLELTQNHLETLGV